MKCQVTSDITRKVMISREEKVASYKDICGEEKIVVHLGYNNDPLIQIVENDKLLQIPLKRELYGEGSGLSRSWEVLSIFFSNHNIEPIWLNCGFNWGRYDKEKGAWTGCVGKVR